MIAWIVVAQLASPSMLTSSAAGCNPPNESKAERVKRLRAELEEAETALRLDRIAAKVNAQMQRRKTR